VLSVLGTVASVVAAYNAIQAKLRAAEVAADVRRAADTRTIHESFTDVERQAADLLKYIDLQNLQMSLYCAREILRTSNFIAIRWNANLSVNTRNNLVSAREQLNSIIGMLNRGPADALPPARNASLKRSAQRLANIFNEELARAAGARDGVQE
jgi:hypothetical protein